MRIDGRAVVVPGDNVDTDVLYPGEYLNIDEPSEMSRYLFEGLDPLLRDLLTGDVILFVGENFGMGSSREHAPIAMRGSGVRCLVGKSFARIFHRNCVNLGLPVLVCPTAVDAVIGDEPVSVDLEGGTVRVGGNEFATAGMPPFVIEMAGDGGLVPWARRKLRADENRRAC